MSELAIMLLVVYLLATVFYAGATYLDAPNYGHARTSFVTAANVAATAALWPVLVLWFGLKDTINVSWKLWRGQS